MPLTKVKNSVTEYLTSLTGAVSRGLEDKLSDTISVKDFGAKGDGVNDEAPAFTASAVSGNPVFVPSGTYKLLSDVSGTFYSLGGVVVTGNGKIRILDLTKNPTLISSEIVRPVFIRQTGTISSGSNQLTVQDGSQWKVGDCVLISGASGTLATYSKTFTINGSPYSDGKIFIVCDGFIFNAATTDGAVDVLSSDSASTVASKIRAGSWPGWVVTGSGASVTFTRSKAGVTVGALWSISVSIPITETVVTEGAGHLIANVLSISGNVLTLDVTAGASVTDALCYLEHGTKISNAITSGVNSVHMVKGEYLFFNGLKFTQQGPSFTGDGVQAVTIYVIGAPSSSTIEFESSVAGGAMQGVTCGGFTLNMQGARRRGLVCRRLWDGSNIKDVLVDFVDSTSTGISILRHSTQAPPATSNEQTVVSQTVVIENVNVLRRNSSGDVPIAYFEYVQEGTFNNFKAGTSSESNAWQSTIAVQIEGCRGVAFYQCSFLGVDRGAKITSVFGLCKTITFDSCTFETSNKQVDSAGGVYDIEDVHIRNPRCIGGGGVGEFLLQRCKKGYIEAIGRNVTLGASTSSINVVMYGAGTFTDSGTNNRFTRIPDGVSSKQINQSVSGFTWTNGTNETFSTDSPSVSLDTGVLVSVNRSGTVTLNRVTVGAVDSGGAGFRVLRVIN